MMYHRCAIAKDQVSCSDPLVFFVFYFFFEKLF
jgi:hypothetical protein